MTVTSGSARASPYPSGVVALAQGARWGQCGDALTAERALGILDVAAAHHVHVGVAGAVGDVPHAGGLHLGAHVDAAQALDALVVVADEGERRVPCLARQVLLVGKVEDAEVVGEGLQRAVAGAHAGGALRVVLREQELHVGLAGHADLRAVRAHDHAVEDVVVAGRDQLVDALDLHDADAACAHLVEVLQIAQRRDLDACRTGRLQDGGVLRDRDLLAVDSKGYHCSILPPRNAPKPK
jgi:hypothetical protein